MKIILILLVHRLMVYQKLQIKTQTFIKYKTHKHNYITTNIFKHQMIFKIFLYFSYK